MSTAGNRHELARYELPDGDERVLWAQRINGRVAISDVPAQSWGRVYLVERQIDSTAAMHGLVNAYIDDSIARGEPAALIPAELRDGDDRA
jgi:hypothetical protein